VALEFRWVAAPVLSAPSQKPVRTDHDDSNPTAAKKQNTATETPSALQKQKETESKMDDDGNLPAQCGRRTSTSIKKGSTPKAFYDKYGDTEHDAGSRIAAKLVEHGLYSDSSGDSDSEDYLTATDDERCNTKSEP